MNFTFIQDLGEYLENNDVFQWSFVMAGCKAVALALLLFKIIDVFISSSINLDGSAPKVGSLFGIFGYAFFIMSSDFIIGSIENAFSFVDGMMNTTDSSLYTDLLLQIAEHSDAVHEDLGWMELFSMPFDILESVFYGMILTFLITVCKIADLAMTSGYLLVRLFLIQLMKLLFPVIIALSTLDMSKDLLGKWIKRYIGLFLLGLAYIGIINFCAVLQNLLLTQFQTFEDGDIANMGHVIYGGCVTVIVVFTFKAKMFGTVTSYINSLFS